MNGFTTTKSSAYLNFINGPRERAGEGQVKSTVPYVMNLLYLSILIPLLDSTMEWKENMSCHSAMCILREEEENK